MFFEQKEVDYKYILPICLYIGIGYLGIKLYRNKNSFNFDWGEFGLVNLILAIVFLGIGIVGTIEEYTAAQITGYIGAAKFMFSFIRGFFD
ncbi:hypothetical protein ATO12_17090 [Aquimarina atlantica]|uniref:Uncharacterized protein n=2 Tax=Aquimarina atlantica TaxID=1317122 RepID=A0A023BUH2_9FLAO|nr:hypothetical protein ATO12_17090 [Aquimarina atlantica]